MKIVHHSILLICGLLIIGCKSNRTNSVNESSNIVNLENSSTTKPLAITSEEGDYIKLIVSRNIGENYAITLYRDT